MTNESKNSSSQTSDGTVTDVSDSSPSLKVLKRYRRNESIDSWTFSSIASDIVVSQWKNEDPVLDIDVRLSDCSRTILWQEWGENQEDALEKICEAISALLKIRSDIEQAYMYLDRVLYLDKVKEDNNDA